MKGMEDVRDSMSNKNPVQDWIAEDEFKTSEKSCMSEFDGSDEENDSSTLKANLSLFVILNVLTKSFT